MPTVRCFLELFEAVSRRDWSAIEKIGQMAAEEERNKKHYNAAHQIQEALEIALSKSSLEDSIGTVSSPILPLSTPPPELLLESKDLLVTTPLLSSRIESQVTDLIGEWRNESKLRQNGLMPRRTVLLYGPSGCGKTHLAKYIAHSLKMRLFVVRFDTLVSSFLGETGANLKKVFDFFAANRCALFIDEIDAIAKVRDDRNELGELKRVVISLLQNLDLISERSILLAATNHEHMLDPAIWRRFEIVMEMEFPTDKNRIDLFERYLECSIPNLYKEDIKKSSFGMTGADIVQICSSVKRKNLMQNSCDLIETLFLSILEHLKRLPLSKNQGKIDERVIHTLLTLKKLQSADYSFQDLEELSGIPHSTLHHRHKNINKDSRKVKDE